MNPWAFAYEGFDPASARPACRHGLLVPELPAGLLRARAAASVGNPVDLTAEATASEISAAVEALVACPDVDVVVIVYTPPFGSGLDETRQAIAEATRHTKKTVLACVVGHDGLIDGRVPSYAFPEQAIEALGHAVGYVEWRERPPGQDAKPPSVKTAAARAFVGAELAAHADGCWLSPASAARLLGCYGVRLVESVNVDGPDAAAEAADRVGLPAVLKTTGPVHKSDVGGVRLELRCAPLLHGYRGSPLVDVAALADQLVRVGSLLEDLPEVAELDLNPVIVTPEGAVTVDARIRIAPCLPPTSPLLRHLR